MQAPDSAQDSRSSVKTEAGGICEQCFSTELDFRGQLLRTAEDGVVVLDTGATANFVRFRWLGNRNLLVEKHGSPRIDLSGVRAF